jgi:hypothetical protein
MNQKRKPRVGKLRTIGDLRHEMGRVFRAVRKEELDSLVGYRLAKILVMMISATRDHELEQRLEILEEEHHAN